MAVDAVVTNLKSMARMISTSEEIAQVYLQGSSYFILFLSCPSLLSLSLSLSLLILSLSCKGGYNISKWGKGNWWAYCQGYGEGWQRGCDHYCGKLKPKLTWVIFRLFLYGPFCFHCMISPLALVSKPYGPTLRISWLMHTASVILIVYNSTWFCLWGVLVLINAHCDCFLVWPRHNVSY